MKKSKVEAAETRERIIQSAAVAFRRNGIHATGLAEIMAAAGLTQGGFYRHFGSKDELVAEVCAEAMSSVVTVTKSVRGDADGETGLQAIVGNFLSLDHRDNQLEGCPLVGLGIELARADEATRAAASDGCQTGRSDCPTDFSKTIQGSQIPRHLRPLGDGRRRDNGARVRRSRTFRGYIAGNQGPLGQVIVKRGAQGPDSVRACGGNLLTGAGVG
jgi:AcrR family transcriptional regulator